MARVLPDFAKISRDKIAAHIDRPCKRTGQWSARSGTRGECAPDTPLILAFCRFFEFLMFFALRAGFLVRGEGGHFLFDFSLLLA